MVKSEVVETLAEYELEDANKHHPKYFASDHEAYAVIKEELEEAEQEMRELSAGLDLMWSRIKWDESIEDNLIDLKRTAYFLIAEVVQVYAMCEKGLRTNALKEVGNEQQG